MSIALHSSPKTQVRASLRRRVTPAAYRSPTPPLEVTSGVEYSQRVTQVGGSYVYRGEGRLKGICHFVGGAFGGAVPHVIYPLLLPSLASYGYTIVATPFDVTFLHGRCADRLQSKFQETLEIMRNQGMMGPVPEDVPVHGIGHSFGALALALMGCRSSHRQSNVLIAFNNKAVEEAIPIPNFLSTVSVAFRLPFLIPDPIPAMKIVAKTALQSTGLTSRTINDALDQVSGVFNEIKDGIVDFDPTPAASARCIEADYCIPKTLLIQFLDDNIDETSALRTLLDGRETTMRSIRGNHLTPCVANLRQWLDGDLVDALQRPALVENDILIQIIIDWLDKNSQT